MKNLSLLFILLLLAGCKGKDRYETIAQELCGCMTPLSEQYHRVTQLSEQGNMTELQALMTDLERAADESEACVEELENKYGDLENEKEQVEAAMEKVCPDIAAMIRELENDNLEE